MYIRDERSSSEVCFGFSLIVLALACVGINMFLEINSCKFRNMAQLEKTNSFLEILIKVYCFRNNFSHF